MINHKKIIHFFIEEKLDDSMTVVDMTAGNGYDTFFLASKAKKVYAVDIQKQALLSTKKRCQNFDNITYILSDHSRLNPYDFQKIHGLVYNLGYLPESDKKTITQAKSTLKSIDSLLPFTKSFVSIAAYTGHPGGMEEYLEIKKYLDSKKIPYHLITYEKDNSPVTFLIDLEKPSTSNILVDELRRLPQTQVEKKLRAIFQPAGTQ